MSNKQDVLRSECEAAGFTFDTYSPGDGITRYRFSPLNDGEYHPTDDAPAKIKRVSYFASFGDYTALGWREALAYATGRVHGVAQALERKEQKMTKQDENESITLTFPMGKGRTVSIKGVGTAIVGIEDEAIGKAELTMDEDETGI